MRKTLLILALVAAAFGGGAALNGRGLGPLWSVISGRLPGDTIATIDGASMARADGDGPRGADAIPAAPVRPLELVAPGSTGGSSSTPSKDRGDREPAGRPAFDPGGLAVVNPPAFDEPSPIPVERPSIRPPDSIASADLEPKRDPAVSRASMETRPADPSGPPGWAAVRGRMRELGVARYWVEGEPGGPARFRCVIPLAGRHAVGQQFEADGDDDLQAAEAALRRVALWRATEAP